MAETVRHRQVDAGAMICHEVATHATSDVIGTVITYPCCWMETALSPYFAISVHIFHESMPLVTFYVYL